MVAVFGAPFDRYRSQGHSTWNAAALLPPALTSSTFTKKSESFQQRDAQYNLWCCCSPAAFYWFVLRVAFQTCVRSIRSPWTWCDWSSNNGPKLCPAILTPRLHNPPKIKLQCQTQPANGWKSNTTNHVSWPLQWGNAHMDLHTHTHVCVCIHAKSAHHSVITRTGRLSGLWLCSRWLNVLDFGKCDRHLSLPRGWCSHYGGTCNESSAVRTVIERLIPILSVVELTVWLYSGKSLPFHVLP